MKVFRLFLMMQLSVLGLFASAAEAQLLARLMELVADSLPPAAPTDLRLGTPVPQPTAGPTAIPPTPIPTPTPLPTPQQWTFCVNAGNICEFVGLRDVRLVAVATGEFVQKTAYGSIPCAPWGFDNRDPAQGQALRCEYGAQKFFPLVNPMPGMAGLPANLKVALGSEGVGLAQTRAAGVSPPVTTGQGSFRTTCSLVKFAFEDPIVYPGRANASHLHVFFGNTAINPSTTTESLRNTGNSTCRGGILNRTSYWAPALFDVKTGEVQTPEDGVFYYKSGYGIDPRVIQPMPAGLRMIAGDMHATSMQNFIGWHCLDRWTENTGTIPTNCGVGSAVRLAVIFPQCWDGVNLDSADHKSHMAYPIYRNPPEVSTCPPSHPVTLPEVTEHFDYRISANSSPANWRLSSDMYTQSQPGGFSAHADWMLGWDSGTMNTIVAQCLNAERDCLVGLIGNGQELY